MDQERMSKQSAGRRKFFTGNLIVAAVFFLAACSGSPSSAGFPSTGGATQTSSGASNLTSTAISTAPVQMNATQPEATQAAQPASTAQAPRCTSPATPTPSLTEGPYFKAGSPERASLLEPGITGIHLIITGYVLTVDCKPVSGALLDFWQADSQGQYDNSGYRLRGHQFTDTSGRYQLETIVPGLYPGRTEHIHVKVQAPGGAVLTTQLFFPGVQNNQEDQIFSPDMVMALQDTKDGKLASFTFILDMH